METHLVIRSHSRYFDFLNVFVVKHRTVALRRGNLGGNVALGSGNLGGFQPGTPKQYVSVWDGTSQL